MSDPSPQYKSAFCAAANALTLVYKQGIADKKVAYEAGQRDSFQRVVSWALRQHAQSRTIPLDQLLSFLKDELENIQQQPQSENTEPRSAIACQPSTSPAVFDFSSQSAPLQLSSSPFASTSQATVSFSSLAFPSSDQHQIALQTSSAAWPNDENGRTKRYLDIDDAAISMMEDEICDSQGKRVRISFL